MIVITTSVALAFSLRSLCALRGFPGPSGNQPQRTRRNAEDWLAANAGIRPYLRFQDYTTKLGSFEVNTKNKNDFTQNIGLRLLCRVALLGDRGSNGQDSTFSQAAVHSEAVSRGIAASSYLPSGSHLAERLQV